MTCATGLQVRQQILRHLAAVAFECGGHTAELSMKRSCDNRGVAMAYPRGGRRNDCQCFGGENKRPPKQSVSKGRPMVGRLERTRWVEECVHRTYCTCPSFSNNRYMRRCAMIECQSAFLKKLCKRVGVEVGGAPKALRKKTRETQERLPNGAPSADRLPSSGRGPVSAELNTT